MARTTNVPPWQAAVVVLSSTVVGTAVVAFLYLGQILLIPVVLAIFLTFLLAPVVAFLQRWRLGRTPSVVLVVLLVSVVMSGAGWLISMEVRSLIGELPAYTDNINGKIRIFRSMGQGSTLGHLGKMAEDIAEAWNLKPDMKRSQKSGAAKPITQPPAVTPAPDPAWLSQITAWLSPAMTPLSHIALALVLAVFMLLKREALRNRIIRLIGDGPMTAATKAVDDAADRISRYLRMQFLVNSAYGLVWGAGLYFIGLNYFLFWGVLAAGLRYIPYLGASLAALLPLSLSLAQFPGWWPTIAILALLVALELLCNNVAEPYLYGQSIGVSEVAMLISSAFWALLWGPIGLILSAPLTVCLLVLGRHVPRLEFLVVLLGDQPALEPDIRFYQRLLARDEEEALSLLREQLKGGQPVEVFDRVVVPALIYARRERQREVLSEADEESVVQSIREIVEGLEFFPADGTASVEGAEPCRVMLAYPVADGEDRAALELLRQLLDPSVWDLRIASPETLVDEFMEEVRSSAPNFVCIAALPPGGLIHARLACRRLHARFPDIPIIVGRWGLEDDSDAALEQLRGAGALSAATTLSETCDYINSSRLTLPEGATVDDGGGKAMDPVPIHVP